MMISSAERIILLIAIILVAILILPTRLFPQAQFVLKHKLTLQLTAYFVLLGVLAYHFYSHGITVGIIAVLLGGSALGKYIYDTSKSKEQD